jgi:hypothetical protein
MVSRSHQWLVLWAVRKMMADGYLPLGCDGRLPQGGMWNLLPNSLRIHGVQPDAWGVSSSSALAFAEAKTWMDLTSARTRRQLAVIRELLSVEAGPQTRLYIAVPRSVTCELDLALSQAGLLHSKHVHRLHVPDCFLEREYDECA